MNPPPDMAAVVGSRFRAEAQAAVAAASGDPVTARKRMQSATQQFQRAGHPLDAEWCRRAMAEY